MIALLPAAEVPHRAHVRLAWLYLREDSLLDALTRFVEGLKRYAGSLGASTKYHETITWAYLFLIHERMAREADFAFRQAWALCPDSIETVLRYVALLMEQKRFAEAILVAETSGSLPSMKGQEGESLRAVVKEIAKSKQATSGQP